MTEPAIDAERLAALLDGRLDERDRADLLARLASSPDDLEVFADAVAVMAELEERGEEKGIERLRPPSHAPRWPARRWLALAAVLGTVAVAPLLWTRVRPPDIRDPARFVALLPGDRPGLPERWDSRPWPSTRSASGPLTEDARAARVGALLVDLELAVPVHDPAVSELSGEIATLLDEVPAAGPVAATFHEIARSADEPGARLQPLLDRERPEAVRLVGAEMAALGAWAEAGRIAAVRRAPGYFRTRASRTALDRAAQLPGLPAPARSALERVREAVAGESAPDWVAVERDLALVLGALAG